MINAKFKTEYDILNQEINLYKKHFMKIKHLTEGICEIKDINEINKNIKDLKIYLEKNLLDKFSESLVFEGNHSNNAKNFADFKRNVPLSASKFQGFL